MGVFAAQPRDATLDALAALAWSSGTQVPALTAADTASLIAVGTAANNLVRLDGSAKLPAVDGSALINLPSGGKVAQVVSTFSGSMQTGTGTIPFDDTIPQNTEGTEFFTLAITPTNASSTLVFFAHLQVSSNSGSQGTLAFFVDSTANAVGAFPYFIGTGGEHVSAQFTLSAVSTSARTYKMRAGQSSASTVTINGTGGARRYGGVGFSGFSIFEVLP